MKRMLYRMLALAMCLCLGSGCAFGEGTPLPPEMMLTLTPTPGPSPLPVAEPAADGNVIVPQNDSRWVAFQDVVPVGDEVYMLSTNGVLAEMWHWNAGMAQAELVDDGLLYAVNLNSVEEAERNAASTEETFGADVDHAVGAIFTDGESLYGYNNLTGLVFRIDVTAEGLQYTDVATLPAIDSGRYYLPPIGIYGAGDWVLCWLTDHNSRNYSECLLALNLKTGGVKQAVLPAIEAVSSYKDGKVLVLCRANEEQSASGTYAVYCYDPQNDLSECLGVLPVKGVSLNNITYSPALDMVIYQHQTRIMGWTAETGAEQLAFIPTVIRASMTAVGENLLYATDSPEIKCLSLQRGYSTGHSLTLLGGTMSTVLSQFYNRFQDVPVYYTERKNGETWQEQLARTEDMPDMSLWTDPQNYVEAVQAGALMDLSVYPEIKAYIDVLYPVFRDIAVQDGGIYGVPVYAVSYDGWYINKKVMNEMGLTEADVPTTLEGMIAFAQKWNDEWAEKYPHYTLLNNTTNYRERLYYAIEAEWKQLCQKAGKPVAYDDPVYLACLEQLDVADFTKLDEALEQTDPEVSEYKHALIWTGCKDVGNFDTYMEDYSDRIFLPLTLTTDTPYVTPVLQLRMWVVNARSENGEYAAALLAESIAKTADKTAYTLRADKTEPVENESFAEELLYQLDYLASLEASVEDSVNKEAALRRVAEQKEYIDNGLNGRRYLINPSAIEHYRSVIVPAAYVNVSPGNEPDMLLDMDELEHQYLHREITAQELVKALDALRE